MNSESRQSETSFYAKLTHPRMNLKKEIIELEKTYSKVKDPDAKRKIQIQIHDLKRKAGL